GPRRPRPLQGEGVGEGKVDHGGHGERSSGGGQRMSRPLHRAIIHGRRAALIFGLALAAAHAQADQDTLYVTAQADSMSTAGDGGGAAVEWQRMLSDRAGINLGALSYSLAGSRWTYGKV